MHKHNKYGGDIFQYCLPLCVISPSAAVIHRKLFASCGLFDEQLPACEDYDLWLRICHRYPVHYLDQALIIKYGGHDDQLSRKHWGMDRFRIQALHALMQQPSLKPAQHQLARNMLVKKLKILLKGAIKHNNQQILQTYQPLLQQYEGATC
jgi:GT2 family glycosyltransferase